jgi:hypothetical protein
MNLHVTLRRRGVRIDVVGVDLVESPVGRDTLLRLCGGRADDCRNCDEGDSVAVGHDWPLRKPEWAERGWSIRNEFEYSTDTFSLRFLVWTTESKMNSNPRPSSKVSPKPSCLGGGMDPWTASMAMSSVSDQHDLDPPNLSRPDTISELCPTRSLGSQPLQCSCWHGIWI